MRNFLRAAVSCILVGAATAPVLGQTTPANLADLVGAKGGGGEAQLQNRGYRHIKTETSGDSKYSYWWNDASGECISVRTYDGRYAAIVSTLPPDCGKSGGARPVSGEVPQIIAGTNGEGEAIFSSNNCVAYYDRSGYRTKAQPACDAAQLTRADQGMAAYRREQGMSGPVADHSAGVNGDVINLVCHGEGERSSYEVKNGYSWDSDKHKYVYGTRTEYGTKQFDTSVQFQFSGQTGRVRVPDKMIPPIHDGGKNGWWELSDVRVTPDKITASYRLNGLNKPKLEIDRLSGHIHIKGQREFSGSCDDIDHGQRRF